MNGEDKIFLMTAIMAIIGSEETMAKFLLNRDNMERLLAIRENLGREGFEQELIKLKEVIQ